jgi:type II secretory ATPase GspE/PulE/Tfp pilus assembly ATPase PilB-like protein
MLSSEGKKTDSEAIGKPETSSTGATQEELDYEKIFQLIENILSFEACLYHLILPLALEDRHLMLGMVNIDDNAALYFVNNLLLKANYTLTAQAIVAEEHRAILSAYLNHKNTSQTAVIEKAKSLPSENNITQQVNNTYYGDDDSSDSDDLPTLILNTPVSTRNTAHLNNLHQQAGKSVIRESQEYITSPKEPITTKEVVDNITNLTILEVPDLDLLTPIESLISLPPKKLLEELLGRVLAGGIGRLYFERQPYLGRILWSENGVLQSVLEELPISVFQGVLNELKRFAQLPLTTISEARQVEKECLYQNIRILLRLRVIPGVYGEEATLQVLRGAALKFYQQQQLSRLGRDALGISHHLSYKLHQLQDRLLRNPNLNSEQLQAFAALNRLLDQLDQQIKTLTENCQE